MEIIKLGNKDRKKIFECKYCLCQFSGTAEELANMGGSTFYCPCCGKLMSVNEGVWDSKVVQSLDKEAKLQCTLKQVRELCISRRALFGEDACTTCIFHDKSGCQMKGLPKCWLRRNNERIR